MRSARQHLLRNYFAIAARVWIFFAVWITIGIEGQEVRINAAAVVDNTFHVEFDSGVETNYYRLLRGETPENINTPVFLSLGGIGAVRATNDLSARARYYRLQRVPRAAPLDSDTDGIDDDWELHLDGKLNPLDAADAAGDPDANGFTHLQEYIAATTLLTTIAENSPAKGESGVAVTRETVFRLTQPLSPSTLLTTSNLYATFGERKILSRVELASDRKTVTLFYRENLPASARVRVTFDGTNLVDHVGRKLDLDGDGVPGGNAVVDFDTLSITPTTGTAIRGRVLASQITDVDHPLEHVQISVVGDEQNQFTFTDAQGYFTLSPCPSGKFFVIINGHTATESAWPNGAYYPVVTKPWEAVAGRTNLVNAGTGIIYLPLIKAETLQAVDPTTTNTISFPAEVIQQNPALAGVTVTVPPNTLFDETGQRGGKIGIAPVASDRLPERLPEGINHTIDISIQTDGPQNLDRPLPVRFPNLPDPKTGLKLPPGAKTALMSYNHDTGRWEIQGPMTVTADGNFVETDPGVGVRQPGWHGTMPGAQGSGGPITGPGGAPGGTGPNPPCTGDFDCDGIPNGQDGDINGDGTPNNQDSDMDGDGIPNDQDDDRDGDGIPNDDDPNPDGPTESFNLTVNNGTGGGIYQPGITVSITANSPSPGQVFDQWVGIAVASATSASTSLTMPQNDAMVTATYKTPECPMADSIQHVENTPGSLVPELQSARDTFRAKILAQPGAQTFQVTSEYRSLPYQEHFWSLRTTFIALNDLPGISDYVLPIGSGRPQLRIASDSPNIGCQELVDKLNQEIVNHTLVHGTPNNAPSVSNPARPENAKHTQGKAFDAVITGLNWTRIDQLAEESGLIRPYKSTDPIHYELKP